MKINPRLLVIPLLLVACALTLNHAVQDYQFNREAGTLLLKLPRLYRDEARGAFTHSDLAWRQRRGLLTSIIFGAYCAGLGGLWALEKSRKVPLPPERRTLNILSLSMAGLLLVGAVSGLISDASSNRQLVGERGVILRGAQAGGRYISEPNYFSWHQILNASIERGSSEGKGIPVSTMTLTLAQPVRESSTWQILIPTALEQETRDVLGHHISPDS